MIHHDGSSWMFDLYSLVYFDGRQTAETNIKLYRVIWNYKLCSGAVGGRLIKTDHKDFISQHWPQKGTRWWGLAHNQVLDETSQSFVTSLENVRTSFCVCGWTRISLTESRGSSWICGPTLCVFTYISGLWQCREKAGGDFNQLWCCRDTKPTALSDWLKGSSDGIEGLSKRSKQKLIWTMSRRTATDKD